MLFSHTASLAVAATLLLGTVSAAPVPTGRSSVDLTRHNHDYLQSSGGTSIMIPLEAMADHGEEITSASAKAKHDEALFILRKVSKQIAYIKSEDHDGTLTPEVDPILQSNRPAMKSHTVLSKENLEHPQLLKSSYDEGTKGVALAQTQLGLVKAIREKQVAKRKDDSARAKELERQRKKHESGKSQEQKDKEKRVYFAKKSAEYRVRKRGGKH